MNLLFLKRIPLFCRFWLTVFLIMILISEVQAQAWGETLGARSSGMNHCSVALTGFWNVRNNPAGIADFNTVSLGLNYADRFSMQQLSTQSLAAVIPVGWGVIAVDFNYYGYALYHEMSGGLVYARRLSKRLRAGIQLDYLHVAFGEGYGSSGRMTFGVGVQYDVSKNLTFGAYVYNPVSLEQDTLQNITVPFIFRTGLGYAFSEKLLTTVETEKNALLDYWNVRAGVEYRPDEKFAFRMGTGTHQEVFSFGMGYRWRNLMLDVSSTVHQQLGLSPQFSVIYSFQP